jgi:hypothetical protein
LEAYGLEVVARQKVSVAELRGVLKASGIIAIFPIQTDNGLNHYLVAMKHGSRGPVVIDPPSSVRNMEEDFEKRRTTPVGGVVLFVSRPTAAQRSQADLVKCEPNHSDLGRFRMGDPVRSKPVKKLLALTNISDRPVVVSQVVTHCGCLRSDWNGGVLKAGEKVDVPATIILGGWSPGKLTRKLVFKFADDTTCSAAFTVDTLTAEQIQQLEVLVDKPLRVVLNGDEQMTRQVPLRLVGVKLEDIKISSDRPWLECELRKGEQKSEPYILLRIGPVRIPDMNDRIEGTVSILARSWQDPVSVPVEVIRRDVYRIEPSVVRLGRVSSTATVSLIPSGSAPPPLAGLEILAGPKQIKIEHKIGPHGAIKLQLTLLEAISQPVSLLRLRMGPENGNGPIIALVVTHDKE